MIATKKNNINLQLSPRLCALINGELKEGENLLFTMPRSLRSVFYEYLWLSVFLIAWTIFAIINSPDKGQSLFGIPLELYFIGFGIFWIFYFTILLLMAKRTAYVITSNRAMIVKIPFLGDISLKTYYFNELRNYKRRNHFNHLTSFIFEQVSTDNEGGYIEIGFKRVSNGDDVDDCLKKILKS